MLFLLGFIIGAATMAVIITFATHPDDARALYDWAKGKVTRKEG